MTGLKKILLVGFGNLGYRYLEGIVKSSKKFKISVIDPNIETHLKMDQLNYKNHIISVHKEMDSIDDKNFDLLINSTSSHNRHNILKKYVNHFNIKNFILEKILANNLNELNDIKLLFEGKSCWVNTFFRSMNLFKELKLKIERPFNMSIYGGNWGLCCNSIHFIDLASWLSGAKISKIDNSFLTPNWINSKREGYKEVNGIIKVFFENNSYLELVCNNKPYEIKMKISTKGIKFNWDLELGQLVLNEKKQNLKLPFQSNMSKGLVEKLIYSDHCDLTVLNESINLHYKYVEALLDHWNKTNNRKDKFIPIT